jgi:hypothetical protein
MSALGRDNQNNRREKTAHVSILATDGASRIEVLHGDIRVITIYISTNSINPSLQSYRQSLLQLFLYLIEGYRIPRLESSSDVSQDIVQLFINICTQVDRGKSIGSILDDTGRVIITNSTKITVFANENSLVAESDERLPQQNADNEFPSLEELERQNQQRNQRRQLQQQQQQQLELDEQKQQQLQLQQLEEEQRRRLQLWEAELENQQRERRRIQREAMRQGINELIGLLRTDGGNDTQVGNVLAEVGQMFVGNQQNRQDQAQLTPITPSAPSTTPITQLPTQLPNDYARTTADRRRQSSGLFNSILPVVNALPFPLPLPLPLPLNIFAGRPASNMQVQHNYSNQHNQQVPNRTHPNVQQEDSPFLEPLVRNLNDPQPMPMPMPQPQHPTRELNQPNRPIQPAQVQITTPTPTPTPIINLENNQHVRPINPVRRQDETDESDIPNRFVENHNGARREIFPDEKNNITQETLPDANQPDTGIVHPSHIVPIRTANSLELIKKIASNIFELIKSGKTRPPDFKSKTKSSLTKIKNYIHNISRVWLSQSEIELFVSELTKLQ